MSVAPGASDALASNATASDAEVVTSDYHALRHDVRVVALPRDVVAVRGPDAFEYLQGQCSQDLAPLADGQCTDALLLNAQGKVDALVRITKVAAEEFVVDVDGGFADIVIARLQRFKLRVKVEIDRLAWRCVALRGPGSAGLDLAGGPLVLPFGWGGMVGVDLLGEDARPPAGVPACSPPAWEAVRIEAGIPHMGAELDDRTIPEEAGLVGRCVSFDKGCYTGQELVARLDARGNRVARRLRGLVLDAPATVDARAVRGAAVEAGGRAVGSVTSAAWSPGLGALVGLAYLHRSVEATAPVLVRVTSTAGADGPALPVGADGEPAMAAEVRELPLVV